MDTQDNPACRERAIGLLCRAARLLLENGSETYRVEETAIRMAQGFGLHQVNISAFPTTILLEADGSARVVRVSRRGTNTLRIAQVNSISRRVSCGEMTADEADAELTRIERAPGPSQRTLLLAYAVAAAAFSMLYGGDVGAFIVAFLLGLLAQAVQPLFSRIEMGALFGNFAGGLTTAFFAQTLAMILPYGNVNATITGGILPLLSGLLMTTAVRDTMYGDLVSGMSRALEALLLAASVALGVYVGLKLAAMMGGVLL